MNKMTSKDLNRISAMMLEGVEWDERYQPKFAVDCFDDTESNASVKVLWSGDYEFSWWNPAHDWRHLGELIETFEVSLTRYGDEVKGWEASMVNPSTNKVEHYFSESPNEAVLMLLYLS